MAHYAILDENNIVISVITGMDEDVSIDGITDWELFYSEQFGKRALRTSYNTYNGEHKTGGIPFRGNYAGIGFVYNEDLDIFLPPKLYPSWIIDEKTSSWVAPIPYPEDGQKYEWDEESTSWVTT